jgi:hypothetical protein
MYQISEEKSGKFAVWENGKQVAEFVKYKMAREFVLVSIEMNGTLDGEG